ncbi:MAG: sulfotransferase [Actinomycetia bacterium]|nr:sulfotransferase [Actinomycetes bacterium]
MKVLFIGGLGRSGSTLVESLLNELPQTLAVGETIHLWERGIRDQERCACGEAFAACAHWAAVGQEAFGGWDQVDLDEIIGLRWSIDRSRRLPLIAASHLLHRPSEAEQRYLDHLRAVLVAAARVGGDGPGGREPEVLLESSKHLSTAALLALDPKLDVRVLHLVRDPRGVAYSWTKEVSRPEADGKLMPIYKPSRTAMRWVTDNLGFEILARRVQTLTLSYEGFLADPIGSILAIGRLVDLPAHELDLGFIDGNRATVSTPLHSVAGNPMRFGGQELTLRLDDAWRTKLPRRDRQVVTAITAPQLSRYRTPLISGEHGGWTGDDSRLGRDNSPVSAGDALGR